MWTAAAPDLPLTAEIERLIPSFRYRFDFGYLPACVLFEIQGGIYARGKSGHTSATGIARDADKLNRAQMQGYILFQLTTKQLTKEYIEELAAYVRAKNTTDKSSDT